MQTVEVTYQIANDARKHWLVKAATRAGLRGIESVRIPTSATPSIVWDVVAGATRVSTAELAERTAGPVGLALADFSMAQPQVIDLIPESIARRLGVFPMWQDEHTIIVAVSDPTSLETEHVVEIASGRRAAFVFACPAAIDGALNAAYTRKRTTGRP